MTEKRPMTPFAAALFDTLKHAAEHFRHDAAALRPIVVAHGFIGPDNERLYLCAGRGECLDIALRHDDRMPLTQADLNIETVLFHNHGQIRCDNCGAALTVHGPDPRD